MPYTFKRYTFVLPLIFIASFLFNCSKNDDTPKTTDNLNKEIAFVKTIGGTKNESAQSIIKTSDGGYLILGYVQSADGDVLNKQNESFDYWLLKYDQNNALQWQKTYGGSDDDRGSDVIQTSDGGFAILGYSQSNDGDVTENNGFNDFWISKLDSSGTISWEKSFGFSGADKGISIIQTNDNGYLLTGVLDVSASNGEGNSKSLSSKRHAGGDYWVIKLNALGENEWTRFFGGTFTDTPYDALQTEDNGYIIVGSSDSEDVDIKGNKGSYDFWVIKISDTGNLVWEKSFGGSETDEARAIVKSSDGNYIIVGDTRSSNMDVSNNKGAADCWVIKISPVGELIWEKTFGGSSFDSSHAIIKTQDNGFIISGNSRSADSDISINQGQNDAWVFKIDANANIEWQKTVGGSDIDLAYDVIELSDETVIVVGESNSSNIDIPENKGFSDLLIFKIK
ncbi:hypothetical protein Q4Q35_20790 [Flavivirga aquimarina]|uniref:Bulb-type lectin domain-containing protein n=1 Tax=Flavivirga aquimarina TaxID=2027862 RepID=A0ABT8WGK2_9FLAO|nr:hypothetical protein [Flavivirga aquimarina]MDO5972243.1 hypothetical protein [Flavivirga aquimarina]